MSTWFITGASRGLGAEIARAALRGGDNVVATVRTIHRSPDLCAFRSRSAPDGHTTPRSLSSRANDATARPRARSPNIHRSHGAATRSGANT